MIWERFGAGAEERSRRERWLAAGKATVTHPRFGKIVVPCASKLSAIINAAEYWRCEWSEILSAQVRVWEPGDGKVIRPKEFVKKEKQHG